MFNYQLSTFQLPLNSQLSTLNYLLANICCRYFT